MEFSSKRFLGPMLAWAQNRLPSNKGPSVRLAEPRVTEGRGPCLITRETEREIESTSVRLVPVSVMNSKNSLDILSSPSNQIVWGSCILITGLVNRPCSVAGFIKWKFLIVSLSIKHVHI